MDFCDKSALSFENKIVLAPMVRISGLVTRLMALKYGADLVYCEEIIDHKILSTTRVENETFGTIDYVHTDGTFVFRTCSAEKEKLIFQIGTSDADRALLAAKKVEQDVSAIDVNMGCPKEFSIKGGMGAALLSQPEKVKKILTTLVDGLSIPVTCKMRVLRTIEETVEFVKMLESTGVAAITIHGRTIDERQKDDNRWAYIKAAAESVKIPVLANGGSREVNDYKDIEHIRELSGCSSVMIARAAEWNPSIFRKEGPLPLRDIINEFITWCIDYNNHFTSTKYCIQQMMHEVLDVWDEGPKVLGSRCLRDLHEAFNMIDYNRMVQKKHLLPELTDDDNICIRRKVAEDGNISLDIPIKYEKINYPSRKSPKMLLNEWAYKNRLQKPLYETVDRPVDRKFYSVLTVEGKKYTVPFWHKSKQLAEQSCAVACMMICGLPDERRTDRRTDVDIIEQKLREIQGEIFMENIVTTGNSNDNCAKTTTIVTTGNSNDNCAKTTTIDEPVPDDHNNVSRKRVYDESFPESAEISIHSSTELLCKENTMSCNCRNNNESSAILRCERCLSHLKCEVNPNNEHNTLSENKNCDDNVRQTDKDLTTDEQINTNCVR